jgi:valyl-tRNA synthetase
MAEDANSWLPDAGAPVEDRWIFSRLNECAQQMNRAIDQYRYHEAAQTVWHFIYDDFCDWYIELKKISFVEGSGLNDDWRNILAVFESLLRLLHPVMPFLTEELWHRLGGEEGASISLAAFPQFDPARYDSEAEREIGLLQAVVTAARGIRADLSLDPKLPLEGRISRPVDFRAVQRLAGVSLMVGEVPKTGAVRSTPDFDLVLDVPHGQLEAQRRRLEKERDQLIKNIANSQRQLSDEIFLSKAPAKVVESIRAKLVEYETQLRKIEDSLNG